MKKKIHSCLVVLALSGLLAIALLPVHIYPAGPAEAAVLKSENTKQLTSAGDYSPGDVTEDSFIYLPIILRPCSDFFDNFSDPGSGWWVGEDAYVRAEYLNGEYRILSKNDLYFYPFRAPTCERENYIVEVDARWVGETGYSYGIIFGVKGILDEFYLFEVNTDYQAYMLFKYDSGGYTLIIGPTSSSAIQAGTASNHLKVTRSGDQISLYANGTHLGTWTEDTITGLTSMGLFSTPYDGYPTSDARFDNYRVVSTASADMLTPAQDISAGMPQSTEFSAFNAQTYRLPAGWEHGERQKP